MSSKAAATAIRKPASLAAKTAGKTVGELALSVDQIYERILTAILEHRLPPGTQLVEHRLAELFDVSRTKIREAIGRLVHDRIATNFPNRGAFITSPTPEEAREVFATRRLIEPELVRLAAQKATARQIAALRSHVGREAKARAGSNPYALMPLTGEFHLLIAEISGNGFLARTLRELESLTCLSIILYDAPGSESCPQDEHERLLAALEARDAEGAAALMLHHLDHIERGLKLAPRLEESRSLEDAFR